MDKLYIVQNEQDLINPVNEFIAKINEPLKNNGLVILLNGLTGSGKTFFIQKIINELGVDEEIKSPIFSLLNKYDVNSIKASNLHTIVYIDAYRLEEHHHDTLRIKDYVDEPGVLVFVEWPTVINLDKSLAFANISVELIQEDIRKIHIEYLK